MVKRFCSFFLLLMLTAVNAYSATLSASVDRPRMNSNETIALTVQYDEDTSEEPDTTALEQQFSIVSRNQASSIQIINGHTSGTTTWYYELMPRKTGTLLIPSFSIEGNFSDAIPVEVTKVDPGSSQYGQQDIYTESAADNPKPYVQQQVVITWRLVTRLNISEAQLVPPQIDGALVQDLGNRQFQRANAAGGVEHVIEQRYAIFPQRSGTLTIPPQEFRLVANYMQRWSRGIIQPAQKQLAAHTEELSLDVLPADNSRPANWLPASAMDISQEFSGLDNQQAHVGTSFTRSIRIRAEGLSAEQLPAIDMQADGIKVYSEKPQLSNKSAGQNIVGWRFEQAAVIATRAGKQVLPAIRIPWFDVKNQQWREAVLPETTIDVLPDNTGQTAKPAPSAGSTQTQQTEPATTATSETPGNGKTTAATTKHWRLLDHWWQMAIAILLILLLTALLYVVHLQRQLRQRGNAPSSANNRQTAVQPPADVLLPLEGDLQALHRNLLAWSRQSAAHRQALNDPSIRPLVDMLEKHLYGNGPAPDRQALQDLPVQLERLVKNSQATQNQTTPLENLYH